VPAIPSIPHDPRATVLQLPVILLAVPSLPAFKVVHDYLYHRRIDRVLSALMPIPDDLLSSLRGQSTSEALATRGMLKQLSTHVCAMGRANPTALMGNVSHVTEFWQDVVALGINDPDLWSIIDFAWDTVSPCFQALLLLLRLIFPIGAWCFHNRSQSQQVNEILRLSKSSFA
jgi:hypothetical protein